MYQLVNESRPLNPQHLYLAASLNETNLTCLTAVETSKPSQEQCLLTLAAFTLGGARKQSFINSKADRAKAFMSLVERVGRLQGGDTGKCVGPCIAQ